jgi:membrane associated rhomboid family serine protease
MEEIKNAPVTLIIIIITVLTSLGAFSNAKLMSDYIFEPVRVNRNKQYYRFFTSGFLHADQMHLIFNMISLFFFGPFVETGFKTIFGSSMGSLLYAAMYLLALPMALLPTYFKNKNNPYYRGLGASGAVSAVVFAGLLLAPTILIGIYIIPPFIPGFIFAPLYLVISAVMEKRAKDNVNHSAHIWGSVFGLVFVIIAGFAIAGVNIPESCIAQIKWWLASKGIG